MKNKVFFLALFLFPFQILFAQKELLFIADSQEPIWAEKILLKENHNIEASDSLFSHILTHQNATVFFLGDLVAKGSSSKSWKRIDTFLDSLNQCKIPYYAIKGNHEYLFNAKKGKENFHKRFPDIDKNIFFVIVDSVGVMMLNSNFDQLTSQEKEDMLATYNALMDSLQKSNAVKAIVVCVHHSPYTNSSVVSSSAEVQNQMVPTYLQTPKAVLFLSGHSHNLELFQQQGKYFCVIGGGGGLKQKLKKPEEQLYTEILPEKNRFNYFYITLQRNNNILHIKSHGINNYNEAETVEDLFSITIP